MVANAGIAIIKPLIESELDNLLLLISFRI